MLSLVMNFFVLNKCQGYLLLSNAFYFAFILCSSMKVDVAKGQALNQSLICGFAFFSYNYSNCVFSVVHL
jgi:hypothetical protein